LRGGAAGAVVPVGGVACVALFAMEVRVDHHAGSRFQFVDFGVGPLPFAVRVPPERAQRGLEGCRRLVFREGRLELRGVHGASLAQLKCELDHMLSKNILIEIGTTKAIQSEQMGSQWTRIKVP
jgi:hypothetical protein